MTGPLAELLIGRTLADRYRVEEVIGRGGMSVVYRAVDQRLGRPVALKLISLPAGEAGRDDLRARFRREAASVARISSHPNVVQVFDYGTDPELGLDFLIMELLVGRDLKAALRAAPPTPAEAVRVILEAARGVAAGHRAGLVHRDVKPANVFLVGEGQIEGVKILDFGIAKAVELDVDEELTRAGQLPHSPAYASPEQLDPERTPAPTSDVFQLGLVAYELLAGERPFDDEHRGALHAGRSLPLPARGRWAQVSPAVREVVERALRPDPAERFADAAAFAEALAGLDLAAVASRPASEEDATLLVAPDLPPPPPATAPPSPRRRAPVRPAHPARAWVRRGVLGLVALVAVWALLRAAGGGEEPSAAAGALDTAALDEEFQPLVQEAYEALLEERSDDAGPDAAEAVRQVILDLNHAWVQGDLERHLTHYADRVDFYSARNAPRSRVRRERGEALERYPAREIVVHNTAVEFTQPGTARALVDKSWEFGGEDERWSGEARQELMLRRGEAGRWRVVAERDAEVRRSERTRG